MTTMPSPLRRRLRRLRRTLGYGLATLVILAGLCVATLSQLLPLLAREPQAVADWLAARASVPVEVAALQARWTRSGPLFDLEGLSIGSGDERLDIGRAALQLDVYAGLLPGRPFASLRLDGLALTLERSAAGRWQLQGLGERSSAPADGALSQLEALGELVIDRASLRVIDLVSERRWELSRFDARLRPLGERLQFAAAAYAGDGAPLRLSGELGADRRSGRLYVEAREVDLAPWARGVTLRGFSLDEGRLSGALWLDLADGELAAGDLTLVSAALGLQPVSGGVPLQLRPPSARGSFQRTAEGWTIGVEAEGEAWLRLDRRADRTLLQAGGIELAPLLALLPAALDAPADAAPDEGADAMGSLGARLREVEASGRIELLRMELVEDRVHRLDARLARLALAAVGERPGFEGLALDARWEGDQLRLGIASPDFSLLWPPALGEPLDMALLGEVLALQADGEWRLASEQLAVRGEDFGFDAAGELRFDGGRPSADLRVQVFESAIVAAKRFWIRNRMPEAAVRWLDEALVDGRLASGHLLLHGDLDDWPFAGGQGRMLAEANVEDVTLRYRPDWPLATGLGGRATFLNRRIDVEVSADVMGNTVRRAVGEIASLAEPRLTLQIEGGGSGPGLLELLRRSPLQARYREHLQSLSIGGSAEVSLALDVPLVKRLGEFSMDGRARLRESDLRDSRWGIALDAAEGELRFSQRGLKADALDVVYSGQSAAFSIALGSYTDDPGNAVETSLRGRIEANTLLDIQPGLAWLKPLMSGASDWQIGVTVPMGDGVPRLMIASDLVGTTLALPPPLSKAAAVRMPLQGEVALAPAAGETGNALDLRLGGLMRLYGRLGEDARFDGIAAFGEVADVERPARGLRVVGQVPVLDASAWSALAAASAGGDGGIVDVDLFAGELDLMDRGFEETRLRLDRPAEGALRLRFDGPGLAGEIELPAEAQRAERGITGRFERLHWRRPRGGQGLPTLVDPASIPPLHLWVQDLRLGDARLGETRLETYPQGTGMRVDLFESRSDALQLFGRGDWTRANGIDQSSFELEFTAGELGAMLRALGFSELIEGGQTLATLRARWPGAPSAFAMEQVEGGLEISVGPGRVPQVEPGAGRLLGLFSLGEIPRRLALDFSDFFRSGLGFNAITGSFRFEAGDAHTDDLLIESPAAQIRIRGRTGLKAQDYAQTMEVLPRTGSVLPVVGALAGGPAGAAIGAVAQAMLQQPFKQINRTLYRVEGPWNKPVLEVLERGPARPESNERGVPGR